MDQNIYQRIAAVSTEMPHFKKDGTNVAQKFSFISVYQMYNVIRPLLAKHGIVSYPGKIVEKEMQVINSKKWDNYNKREKEQTMFYVALTVEYVFACGKDDFITVQVEGAASDYSDKAQNQAMTSAHKNALKAIFMIADEDPDAKSPGASTSAGSQQDSNPQISQTDLAVGEMLKCRSIKAEAEAMKAAGAVWAKYKASQKEPAFMQAKEMVKQQFKKSS